MVDGIGDNIGKAIGCLIVIIGVVFFIIGGLSFLTVQQCSKYQIRIEKKSKNIIQPPADNNPSADTGKN